MTQQEYRKIIPDPTPETAFFWKKCKEHELWIQRCAGCAKPFFYPRLHCPGCNDRQGGVVPGVGQGNAVQLHDKLQARAPASRMKPHTP